MLDLALEAVTDDRRRDEGQPDDHRPAGVELPQLLGDHSPLADQERRRRARMQDHLEALSRLGIDLVPAPAGKPWSEREVGGAGDWQQLGRALNGAERRRLAGGQSLRRFDFGGQAGGVGSHLALPRRRRMR